MSSIFVAPCFVTDNPVLLILTLSMTYKFRLHNGYRSSKSCQSDVSTAFQDLLGKCSSVSKLHCLLKKLFFTLSHEVLIYINVGERLIS